MISLDELLGSSVWRRKAKLEDSVQDDLHDATMKEVDIGTLHGPYSATGGYRTLWIFFLCGRSRSKTRSLHMRDQFEIKNSSLWSCRMANQKTRTKHKSNQTKRRHADPPTRFAFRHAAESKAKAKEAGPNKNNHEQRFSMDTVVLSTV